MVYALCCMAHATCAKTRLFLLVLLQMRYCNTAVTLVKIAYPYGLMLMAVPCSCPVHNYCTYTLYGLRFEDGDAASGKMDQHDGLHVRKHSSCIFSLVAHFPARRCVAHHPLVTLFASRNARPSPMSRQFARRSTCCCHLRANDRPTLSSQHKGGRRSRGFNGSTKRRGQ